MNYSANNSPQPTTRNTGLNWERQLRELDRKRDHILGASKPCIASIPPGERRKYLPKGEVQKGREDFMDCVSRAVVNNAEAKFNYLIDQRLISLPNARWLRDKGYLDDAGRVTFSDRYIAIKSNTTRQGNSLKAPCHAAHTWGFIPKKMLPAKATMTWADYHRKSDITLEMDILAAQFRNRFPMFYELARDDQFFIEQEMFIVAGYAWPKAIDGEYPRVEYDPNHCFLYFDDPRFTIFDNYEEAKGDFEKKLAPGFKLMEYGYRIRFEEQQVEVDREWLDIVIELLTRGKPAQAMHFINKQLGAWTGF